MVKLTEEMVVARTRVSDFSAVKKLNCWGTELTDVSILRKMKNVEVLSLSINNINTLADFQYCQKLKDLFIRRNNIKDLNEVCYLQGLPNLRNLWLGENPCAEKDGYRLAVLRALPNLEKLDDKVVSSDEVQTALAIGRSLVHPLDVDASPQSDAASPEDIAIDYIAIEYVEETELERPRRYSSSSDQRSFDETQHTHDKYDPDRRNANYSSSTSHHYSQNNQYAYEDYDDRPVIQRNNGDYDERRAYSEYSGNEVSQRMYTPTSQRTQYAVGETADDKRNDRNNYSYDERTRLEYEDSQQQTPQPRRMAVHNEKVEREDTTQVPGWVRHSEKDKCRTQFYYQRRPVTRNSNILSAVLCLVKELDYPSLEVVEMAVRNRMDELEE
ncbi:uncharacterized protein LOC109853169 isoform X2 [Pseudomyrmex gracilis]|uniref:uncharacterized protein LOC109853169 isoform X2 n=1 Tax=Pseudomyrmex gracilis TaxID=219809 RepID=UPI000995585B|nr:uncharacterized protein LOC109853169 isoform X2 [Pseudomyrmex gracilis]